MANVEIATDERGIVMQREMISMRQTIFLIVLFLFGSSAVMGVSWGVGQDAWIALLLALAAGSILVLVYARIISLFPEMDLYDIAQAVFGDIIGKIIIALMTWYAIHLSAIVIRLISEFVKIVTLQETPELPIMITLLVVAGYLAFSGIETLGKWAMFVLPLYLVILLYIMILSTTEIKISNVLPVMEHSVTALGNASLRIFTTTFGGTVLFLTFADSIKKSDNPYKIYLYGIFIATVVLVLVFLLGIMVLGVPMVENSYFPSYRAARMINIGDFLSRIEMIISYNFILAGIAKISICVLAAVKGVKKLFNIKKNGSVLFILSILMLAISIFEFSSVMELFNFTDVFQYYVLPFQVVIPIMLWIGAEIKIGRKRSK